jgi:predicted dehydrogenase
MKPTDPAITRRRFVGSSLAASLAGAAGAAGAAAALPAAAYARVAGAAERINLALIGSGHRGRTLASELGRLAADQNCRLVAVCDIWKVARERAAAEIAGSGDPPARYKNTDELYAQKHIDGVVIATADHQHARMCAEAVKQGKDVYVEKPLAHFLDDALEVRKAVLASKRVVQLGTQRRSSPRTLAAAELLRSGKLGEVVAVDLTWNVNQSKRWRREEEVRQLKEEETDWKRFLLHLPAESFDARKELEFRLFWPYSSGIPDQWMSHLIDLVPLLTGDPFPKSCVASGGIHSFRDGRANPDTFAATFEYPQGFQVVFRSRMGNSDGGVSEVYCTRRGKLDLANGLVTGDGGDGDVPEVKRFEGTVRLPDQGRDGEHLRDFLDCMRSRKTPHSDIESGYQHSVALCMAIDALHTGRRVGYDSAERKLTSL